MVRIKRFLDLLAGFVALLSIGPVLAALDRPLLVVVLIAIPAGWWCDRRERYLLPTWLATLIAVAGMIFYAVQITRAEVAIPVVHAMIVLLAVRLLTPKEGRDYLQIFVLALFILAGSSLIHLEISFVVYLVLLIISVTLGLVMLTVFVTDRSLIMTRAELTRLIKVGLLLPAVSLLLMMVFFVVLPRTRHPLWNFLNPSSQGVVGLAETVEPGTFSQISGVKELVFRAVGPELAPEDRYWRALVLNQSQEGRWLRVEPPPEQQVRIDGPRTVQFGIYPEPRTDRYLMTLDRPTLLTGVYHNRSVDQMYLARSAIDRRFRYEVTASPGGSLQVREGVDRDFYLIPPQEVSPRMRAVAAGIGTEGTGTAARVAALAEFFRGQELSYAQDDLASGPDPLDDFLFGKKRGYCEFFASAYVTLARLAGIPARLVGGYYGGDYNPLGGYYLVTEDTAHIWVEILDADNHWQSIDPSQWAINAATTLGIRDRSQLSALRQLADSLNYHWVQAIVVFDLAQQITLFRDAGESLRDLRAVRLQQGWWHAPAVLLACAVPIVLLLLRRRSSAEARLLAAFKKRVTQRYDAGWLRPGTGLAEIGEHFDDDNCREFARIYYGAVFCDRTLTTAERALLERLLKKIVAKDCDSITNTKA